jgi:hypothetical protein
MYQSLFLGSPCLFIDGTSQVQIRRGDSELPDSRTATQAEVQAEAGTSVQDRQTGCYAGRGPCCRRGRQRRPGFQSGCAHISLFISLYAQGSSDRDCADMAFTADELQSIW